MRASLDLGRDEKFVTLYILLQLTPVLIHLHLHGVPIGIPMSASFFGQQMHAPEIKPVPFGRQLPSCILAKLDGSIRSFLV